MNVRSTCKQILFLASCAGYFLVRGRASREVTAPKSVLIAQLAKMGDMACTTPLFRAVKSAFPNCRVYVLGDEANRELLAENPDVDGYLVYRKNFFETLRALRREKFDFACLAGPSPEILALLYLASIPRIAATVVTEGSAPQQSQTYSLLRHLALSVPHRMGQYAPRGNLSIAPRAARVLWGVGK